MKTIVLIALFALAAIVKCSVTSPASMAKDMYEHYASHSDQLLVAYVGDYKAEGHTYQALVLQARDSSEWDWLQKEFSISTVNDLTGQADLPLTASPNSDPKMGNSDGTIQVYLRRTVDNPDPGLQIKSPVSTPSPLTDKDNPAPKKSHTLRINIKQIGQPDRSETTGYVMGCDQKEHALCLLFYETLEEEQAILDQVRRNLT